MLDIVSIPALWRQCGIAYDNEAPIMRACGRAPMAGPALAPEANQPFASTDGRYQVTFNGEIYNYPRLRTELEREGGPVSHRFGHRSAGGGVAPVAGALP